MLRILKRRFGEGHCFHATGELFMLAGKCFQQQQGCANDDNDVIGFVKLEIQTENVAHG